MLDQNSNVWGAFMSKYNKEFKQKVVNAYLAGEGGYKLLSKRFGIPSHSNIGKWVRDFKHFGNQRLEIKKTHKTYPVQFKLDVLKYKLRTGDSYQEVALEFSIGEPSIICNWFRKWQDEGIEGLSQKKGRPTLSDKINNKNSKKEITREQLEKEVELLEVENAYLKKLRASGINIPNRMLKLSPKSSTNSEKNSN